MSTLINELKAQRAASKDAAKALRSVADGEKRDFTPEERDSFKKYMDEYDRLGIDIAERERLEAADATIDTAERKSAPTGPSTKPIRGFPDVRTMHHHGELRAFKGESAKRDAYESGRFLLATMFGHAASREWCIDQGMSARLMGGGSDEARAQATNVNAAGGFLVPDQFETAVINLRLAYGVFRREANIVTMTSDHVVVPRRTGGLDVYFPGEGVAATESDLSWDQVGLTAKKAATITRMSTEVSEDAVISIADNLATEAAYAFAEKEDRCGFLGDGTATYAGMVGTNVKIIDGTHEVGSVELETNVDLMSEVTLVSCGMVVGTLPDYAVGNAKWYCSRAFKAAVFDRLKLANGQPQQIAGTDGTTHEFMGYPIVISNVMPSATATDYTDLVMCLFGDLRLAASLGHRRGVTVKVDGSLYLAEDQLAVQATERFDINVHDLGDNTNAGPLVAMVGGT